MDFGCRWSGGNNHSLRGRARCVVLIASFREARVRGLAPLCVKTALRTRSDRKFDKVEKIENS